MLNIHWTGNVKGNATMKVVDINGKTVRTLQVKKEQVELNTSVEVGSLVPGIYFLQIQPVNGKAINHQFLKH